MTVDQILKFVTATSHQSSVKFLALPLKLALGLSCFSNQMGLTHTITHPQISGSSMMLIALVIHLYYWTFIGNPSQCRKDLKNNYRIYNIDLSIFIFILSISWVNTKVTSDQIMEWMNEWSFNMSKTDTNLALCGSFFMIQVFEGKLPILQNYRNC